MYLFYDYLFGNVPPVPSWIGWPALSHWQQLYCGQKGVWQYNPNKSRPFNCTSGCHSWMRHNFFIGNITSTPLLVAGMLPICMETPTIRPLSSLWYHLDGNMFGIILLSSNHWFSFLARHIYISNDGQGYDIIFFAFLSNSASFFPASILWPLYSASFQVMDMRRVSIVLPFDVLLLFLVIILLGFLLLLLLKARVWVIGKFLWVLPSCFFLLPSRYLYCNRSSAASTVPIKVGVRGKV